jgi:outer membrane lipopolysaccharide assembly protein LptE/RlpB
VRRARVLLVALVANAVATTGCGYTLAGTGRGTLPENVRSVYVASFVNDTTRVGLEQRLTDAVLRELSARARLKPAADRSAADAELTGHIVGYDASAVRFDAVGRAIEYQITVVAKVTLTDRATDKPIFDDPNFLFRQPYTVPASTTGYFDVEAAALDQLALPFARSLVTTILEGF